MSLFTNVFMKRSVLIFGGRQTVGVSFLINSSYEWASVNLLAGFWGFKYFPIVLNSALALEIWETIS